MNRENRISVIIPAFNEEASIASVLRQIPDWVTDIIVVDNGSRDGTARAAVANGARVVRESHRGYGAACLKGIASARTADILVFLDADFSDHPEEMGKLVDPILSGEADLVIGSRVRGTREKGALTPQARWGNYLACFLIRLIWGAKFSDLGPFRAIRYASLRQLHMQDKDFGWTVEMQIKAAQQHLRYREVPVSYRRRIGKSKISGTVRGVVLAGSKILYTIGKMAITDALGVRKKAFAPPNTQQQRSHQDRLNVFHHSGSKK